MKIHVRLFPLVLAVVCAVPAALFPNIAPAATEATSPPGVENMSVSPEVLQALDAVYLAAKQADAQGVSRPGYRNHSPASTDKAAQTNWKIGRMVAVGLGVAAGVVAINLLSGGFGSASRFYTVTSAMMGGMMGNRLYNKYYGRRTLPSVPRGVAQRITP